MNHDPIVHADLAEEHSAAEALRAAKSVVDLISVWQINAEHFEGAARERLRDEYTTKLREFVTLGAAG